jgi:hypothetical protein
MQPQPQPHEQPQLQYPQQPQFGQYQHAPQPISNQPYSPHYAEPQHQQSFGQGNLPPKPPVPFQPRKGPFGASFWVVASILAVVVLANTMMGNGEAIIIILGLAAAVTGLIAMGSQRRTWANLASRKIAMAVCLTGVAALLVGSVAAGADAAKSARAIASVTPATSAELEADAMAKLKVREDALIKSEGESTAKLKAREDAVTAKETAVGAVAAQAAANTIGQGVWTVGKDMPPGTYRTTKAVTPKKCSWKITVTGSNGSDYVDTDYYVPGGFPTVTLADGQTFESDGCGDWTKQ